MELYQGSYPEHAFDPQMLRTGKYYGCRVGGVLVSAAGVHVYSSRYRVAALGNITTHLEHRNRGYARLVTRSLCHDLLKEVDFIGLNVKADNLPAIRLYQSLGFKISRKYGEFSLKKRF
jgi:predicted GNAT family acetyltransferase